MADFTVNQSTPADQPSTRTVIVSGPMTIKHGAEIMAALVQAMADGEVLLLDVQQVTEIDLIGLQLICATHRSSIAQGKRFSVMKSGNQAIESVVRAVGFSRRTGCILDTQHTCVWTGG